MSLYLSTRSNNGRRAGVLKVMEIKPCPQRSRMSILPQTSRPLLPTSPSRMSSSTEERAPAPSAEVIDECRDYALQKLEAAEQSEMYTCGMQHLNKIILFMMCLSIAKGSCAQTMHTRMCRDRAYANVYVIVQYFGIVPNFIWLRALLFLE